MDKRNYKAITARIIDTAGDKLNDWECGFMESIQEQMESGRELSQPQKDKILSINGKLLGRGW